MPNSMLFRAVLRTYVGHRSLGKCNSPSRLHLISKRLLTNMSNFKQEPHKLLVIPGPIEVADDVLYANAHPSMSHVSPDFIPVFGDCIRMTRDVLYAPTGQPFLIGGSGTLGWDQVAANLVEPGENALVLHTGYFADSFAECLETYGANVDQLKAPVGGVVSYEEIERALKAKNYKIVTITHVDTSTGVLSDVKAITAAVKKASPETLVVVDGVCSVASEEIRFDDWGLDVVLTGSQKGLGTPPGLSILVASPRAIKVAETRKTKPTSYFASWQKWLPIMKAYEAGNPSYFATPPVNLIYAFHRSLATITQGKVSLEQRFALHRQASERIKRVAAELGLSQVATANSHAANGMTALYYPEGIAAPDLLPRLVKKDVVVAGGLHKDIKDKYFRVGHMGITVVEPERGDLDKVVNAIKEAVSEAVDAKNGKL